MTQETQWVCIPAGEYVQGSPLTSAELARTLGGAPEEYQEFPTRVVRITRPFLLRRTPVTVGEFRRFIEATGYRTAADRVGGAYGAKLRVWDFTPGLNWAAPGFAQGEDHPVACVTWVDACAYIAWVNQAGERVCRLPNEVEWEYACRAGCASEFFWGDSIALGREYLNAADGSGTPDGQAWKRAFPFNNGYCGTSPVGRFKPNAWGLRDMLGNVWEWQADILPDDGRGKTRVVRGGAWRTPPMRCRCAVRNPDAPDVPFVCHGMRLACDL